MQFQDFNRELTADESPDALIAAVHPRISSMAAFYARVAHVDADDLCQDALLAILIAARDYQPQAGSLRAWLVRRARWRMLDFIKHQRFRQCQSYNEAHDENAAGELFDDGGVEQEEFIQTLSDIQQRIVRCLMFGWTWRDTGAELGFSSANVAYHMREIRRRYDAWNLDHHQNHSLASSTV
jgi:RNA polymerase sigma factor (sigma-70 family)